MALAIFKQNFKSDIAQEMLKEFSVYSEDVYYLFVGKVNAWPNDSVPPTSLDTIENELDSFRNSFFLKRITQSDVRQVINRFPWVQNSVYTQYNDTIDLFDETLPKGSSDFFVITPENNVYKCLSNNNGSESTVMPTGRKSINIKTSDNYIWKYMCSLSEGDLDFKTSHKIPIRFAAATDLDPNLVDQYSVQTSAVRGSVPVVELTEVGAPYLLGTTGSGLPVGRTESSGSTAIQVIGLYGQENLYAGYTVKVVSGYGEGQVKTIVSNTTGGILYVDSTWEQLPDASTDATGGQSQAQIVPTISIHGDGSGLIVTPTLEPKEGIQYVNGVDVVSAGQNYTTIDYSIYPGVSGPYNAGTDNQHRGPDPAAIGETTVNFVSSPGDGHGYDIRKELGANSFVMLIKLLASEMQSHGLTAANEFRQFGLIKNPVLSSDYQGGLYTDLVAGKHIADQYNMTVNQIEGIDFTEQSFNDSSNTPTGITATYVIGASSNSMAKVISWTPQTTSQGTLVIEQPSGDFITNERVSWFLLANGVTGSVENKEIEILAGQLNAGRFGSIVSNIANLHTFNQTVRVTVGATAGAVYTDSTFDEDSKYYNYASGISGSSFRSLSWTNSVTGASGSGLLHGVDYIPGLKIGDTIYGSTGATMGYVTAVTGPDLRYDRGEVLYIQNMQPITRTAQQEEEIKIQVGF